jgi:hypothetical protein
MSFIFLVIIFSWELIQKGKYNIGRKINIIGTYPLVWSNIHYHRSLDAVVVITTMDDQLSGLENVHVYFKTDSKSAYALKKHFQIKPSRVDNVFLSYIAGDYGNNVVGVCTFAGLMLGYLAEKTKAIIIDLQQEQSRPLILPYEDLKRRLNNDKRSFKYLQLIVCGEFVILQHNSYSRSAAYGPGKNSIQLTSGIYLYKIRSLGFFFKLEYFQKLQHESLTTIEYVSPMEVLRKQGMGRVLYYMLNLSDDTRKCQCDRDGNLYSVHHKKTEDSIHIRQFSRHQGYNQTREVVISPTGKGLSSLDGDLYRSLASFRIWSRHTFLGPNNYAFVSLNFIGPFADSMRKHGGNITLFQVKFHPGFCCNARRGRMELHAVMRIPDHFHLFLDTRDRLIAWPMKKVINVPVFAKVLLENVQTG